MSATIAPWTPSVTRAEEQAWPRTTRLMPWLVALLLVLLWLVPFNSILLAGPVPVDVQLDRLVLPVLVLVWVLSMAAGDVAAPRIRLTPVHLALGAFVAVAVLSVVVEGRALAGALELGASVKKLVLLASYAMSFVLVASIVRPRERRAFLGFTLALAALCALGTLWEFRTRTNLFYDWSALLLPDMFRVPVVGGAFGDVDAIGRPLTIGPTEHGLEVATLCAMALPIAIAALLHAEGRRGRIGATIVACLLIAASLSTYRKTAVVAPIGALAVIVALRPRAIVRLLPLGVAAIVAVQVFAPGAAGGVLVQLSSERLSDANTVGDRVADYDAIRPDVISHPLLGHGYGAYDQTRLRILDNELLHRLVETGAIGLIAYVLMVGSPIALALRRRDAATLAAAGAGGALLAASALFDAMSFPHVPYVFLTIAGIAAAGGTDGP